MKPTVKSFLALAEDKEQTIHIARYKSDSADGYCDEEVFCGKPKDVLECYADEKVTEWVAPHFLIAKHYGNLALFCRLTKHQSHYFRNSDKRFYAAGFDDKGKSMNPSADEYIPFVPDILYDDDGIGYLCLMQPSWLHTIDDIRHKIDGIIATDKKIREHDEYYVGSLRDNIISYELVQRVE